MSAEKGGKHLACPVCKRDLLLESTYHFRQDLYRVIVVCGNHDCRLYKRAFMGDAQRFEKAKEAAYAEMKKRVSKRAERRC